MVCTKMSVPPITTISSAPRFCASARAAFNAASMLRATTTPAGKARIAAHHDVGPAGKRLADRKIGLAAHHHRLAHGERLEALEIGALPKRQRIVAADHAVVGDGGEQDDLRCARRRSRSHRHLGLDVRMRLVAFEREILVAEGEDVLHRRIEPQRRQRLRRARQLQMRLLEMIEIKMRVAEGVDELAGLKPGHLRDHHGQQRVGGDVERHAEEDIGGALIELAGQPAAAT